MKTKYDPSEAALVGAAQLLLKGFDIEEVAGGLDAERIEQIASELREERAKDSTITTPKLDLDKLWDLR